MLSKVTLEHLLLGLTEDREAVTLLRTCGTDVDRLRFSVLSYVDNELQFVESATGLAVVYSGDVKPTASFQRVLQRAAIHVAAAGKDEVTGAHVLVAMFAERESHATYFLEEQGINRLAAVNYIAHGISKRSQLVRLTLNESSPDFAAASRHIFISYSHKDSRWLDRLEVHLQPIVDDGCLMYWDDRKIGPGSKWQKEIRQAIDMASIAILMISADYLASEFVTKNDLPIQIG